MIVYTSAANFSTFSLLIPAGGVNYPLQDFLVPFNDLGWTDAGVGADCADVGAISLKVLGTMTDVDLTLDFLRAVPETMNTFVVGLSLAATALVLKPKLNSA